ncbi:MAG: response regulator [Oscillospiraceae bacterium]|nr:response regulator [Oscillospiraceae bacterium]
MADNLKILISENNPAVMVSFSDYFSDKNVQLIYCKKDGAEILEYIRCYHPDAVLCDIFMKNMDAVEMITAAKAAGYDDTLYLISSAYNNDKLVSTVMNSGFDYFFLKPCSPEYLYSIISSMLTIPDSFHPNDMEKPVTDILREFRMPAHIKGYSFHRRAILMAIGNPDIINNVTKRLYPAVAELFGTTPSRVERAMRTAIEISWDRAGDDVLNRYFSYHFGKFTRPSNSEFVACISDIVRMEYLSAAEH